VQQAFSTQSHRNPDDLFKARFNADVYASYEQMLEIARGENGDVTAIDVRPAQLFNGLVPDNASAEMKSVLCASFSSRLLPVMYGHIKNTINLPINTIIDPATKCLFDKATLTALFPTGQQPLVCSCMTGYRASAMALAAHVAGRNVRVYDGLC
jgi:3-mercaptopyruvate sulfurtransferase SseA